MTQQTGEALRMRERFFELATMQDSLFCGDDRGSKIQEAYLSLLGGETNITYNYMVVQEALQPHSVTTPFDEMVQEQTPLIQTEGGLPNAGVHSDTGAEGEGATEINQTS